MEKEFVTYNLALRMKALGYDEPCFGYYIGLGDNKEKPFKFLEEKTEKGQFELIDNVCQAPTWQSAFSWFRDKHDLRAWVQWGSEYLCLGQIQYSSGLIECISHGSTDEEAELACLEKLLEIVEKRNNE